MSEDFKTFEEPPETESETTLVDAADARSLGDNGRAGDPSEANAGAVKRSIPSPMVLPAPPPTVRRGPTPTSPWFDMRRWRRRNKIFVGLAAFLLTTLLATWLSMPLIVAALIRRELPKFEEKLGRDIEFSDVDLHGLTGISLNNVVLRDTNGSGEFVKIDRVTLRTDKSPAFYVDFKIASLDVDGLDLSLKRFEDGTTNYADIEEYVDKLLNKKPPKVPQEPKKPSPLARYFKPLPKLHVTHGRITFQDALEGEYGFRTLDDLELELSQAAPNAPVVFVGGFELSAILAGSAEFRHVLKFEGSVKSKNEGSVKVDFGGGLDLPLVDTLIGRQVRIQQLALDLPATVTISDLLVAGPNGLNSPMLSADKVRVALTQLPPKKMGGVYVKETEIDGLYLDVGIAEDGSLSFDDILLELMGTPPTELRKVAKRLAGQLEKGGRAGAGLAQRKPDTFNVRDYFVTQRLYVSGGEVRVADERRGGVGDLHLHNLELGFGYRGIRKLIELEMGFDLEGGGKLYLEGEYGLRSHDAELSLEVETLALRPFHVEIERRLQEMRQHPPEGEPTSQEERRKGLVSNLLLNVVGTALRLEDAVVGTKLHLALDTDTFKLAASGDVRVDELRIEEPSISKLPLDGMDIHTQFELTYDHEGARLEVPKLSTQLNGARMESRVTLQPFRLGETFVPVDAAPTNFDFRFQLPKQPAQTIANGIPFGLRPALDGIEVEGNLQFELTAKGNFDTLADTALETQVELDGFKVTRWPEDADIGGLNQGMTMKVRDPHALSEHAIYVPPSTHSGPNFQATTTAAESRSRYPEWVVYEDFSPWLVQLITTTEDGSFFSHDGFSHTQILSALQKNVDKEGFARGASTISMQLVKNVYLGRQKTLSRKLQEVILTWMMESVEQVPKKRILEVYFNVIEFGPEIYGIHDAALYYFGKRADDLTLREVAFLVSIIPRPRTGGDHRLRETVTPKTSKRMNWYIDEMVRRKCDPEKNAKKRLTYERRGVDMPYEPCCPSESNLEALKNETVEFFLSEPGELSFRPDLYTSTGRRLTPEPDLGCGTSWDLDVQRETVVPTVP